MPALKIDRVLCRAGFGTAAEPLPGVRVWVEPGRTARSHMNTQTVTGVENDAGGPEVHVEFVNVAGLEEFGIAE